VLLLLSVVVVVVVVRRRRRPPCCCELWTAVVVVVDGRLSLVFVDDGRRRRLVLVLVLVLSVDVVVGVGICSVSRPPLVLDKLIAVFRLRRRCCWPCYSNWTLPLLSSFVLLFSFMLLLST